MRTDIANIDAYGFDFKRPVLMGILNVTPDSFSDGGKFFEVEHALSHALQLVNYGADILDIGGESSRPGAQPVSVDDELERVIPVIESIREKSTIAISIDTTKAEVAERSLLAGANWINDISAMQSDPQMVELISKYNCPVVIMHMQGTPKTMQKNPSYTNVVEEIKSFFANRIRVLNDKGITNIIVDPGIGFGKRLQDNLEILGRLDEFLELGQPVLIGTSRKSFIGKITGNDARHRLGGSMASVLLAAQNGAHIFRVHDVAETREALMIKNAVEHPDLFVD